MNCLITGASVGIGHELAIKLASLGYDLLITYNNNFELCNKLQNEIINKYHVKCITKKCDLRSDGDIKGIIKIFKNNLGNIDVLVNNASISHDNLIEDKSRDEFTSVIDVNLVGTFMMCKYAKDIMNKNGIIINMSSTDGIDTYSLYNIDYSVSKAGIIQLTKCLSLIYNDIHIIAIAPNWVDTESTREMSQEYLNEELKRIGQKELIRVETVVNKIIHIIVDKNIKSGSIMRIEGNENEGN